MRELKFPTENYNSKFIAKLEAKAKANAKAWKPQQPSSKNMKPHDQFS